MNSSPVEEGDRVMFIPNHQEIRPRLEEGEVTYVRKSEHYLNWYDVGIKVRGGEVVNLLVHMTGDIIRVL